MQNGHSTVQDTVCELLDKPSATSALAFANIKAAFDRCRKYVTRRTYGAHAMRRKKKAAAGDLTEDAKKGEAGPARWRWGGGRRGWGCAKRRSQGLLRPGPEGSRHRVRARAFARGASACVHACVRLRLSA